MDSNNQRHKIILTGRTGAGKSTVGNIIASQTIFDVGDKLQSKTSIIQEEDCFIGGASSLPVTLIDTPGSHDNRKTRYLLRGTLDSIIQAQRGFNLLLHCYNGLSTRFDETDIEDILNLPRIFTKGVVDHIYIVITCLNMASDTQRKEIIEKHQTQLVKILKEHHITGISENRILFFNSDDPQAFIDNLTEVLPKKPLFKAYENVDSKNPIAALQNPETGKFFKSIIKSLKAQIKSLQEFKDEKINREIQTLQVKIYILEILTNKRGHDLETILKSIKDQNPFCKELANFFLSTEKLKGGEDIMSVFQIAYKVLKDFDSTYKKNHWFKKDYAQVLQDHLEYPFLHQVEQSLAKIIHKNIELSFYPNTSINTFPSNGLLAAVTTGFSTTLLWTVRGATEATVATGLLAATDATITAGAVTGIGLLISLGVFVASFFCWTKDGTIEDIALAARKSLLMSDISQNIIITALLTFCDLCDLAQKP